MNGININIIDGIKYYLCKMYNRVREDRPNKKGTTPTKLKYPLAVALMAPQLHPSSDIPYTLAQLLSVFYIGKPLLYEHDTNSPQSGFIAHCHVTSDKKHSKMYEEMDDTNSYKGKKINYHSMIGTVGILNKCINQWLKSKRNNSETDLECSIGYGFNWEIDPEDVVWEGETEEDQILDFTKTLCYATNFLGSELSICGRGRAACAGAGIKKVLTKSSKLEKGEYKKFANIKSVLVKSVLVKSAGNYKKSIGLGSNLMRVLTNSKQRLSRRSLTTNNGSFDKLIRLKGYFKQLTNNNERVYKSSVKVLSKFDESWSQKILNSIKMNYHQLLKKKRDGNIMSNPDKTDSMDTSEDKVVEVDMTKNQEKTLSTEEKAKPDPMEECKKGENKGFKMFLTKIGLSGPDDKEIHKFGLVALKTHYDSTKAFEQDSLKKFPKRYEKFISCLCKADPVSGNENKDKLKTQMKNVTTNIETKEFSMALDKLLTSFEKFTEEKLKSLSSSSNVRSNDIRSKPNSNSFETVMKKYTKTESESIETNNADEITQKENKNLGIINSSTYKVAKNLMDITKSDTGNLRESLNIFLRGGSTSKFKN